MCLDYRLERLVHVETVAAGIQTLAQTSPDVRGPLGRVAGETLSPETADRGRRRM